MTRELTEQELSKAANEAFAKCDIEGGTAARDRALFKAGFIAGLDYQQARIKQLETRVKELEFELEKCDDNLMMYTSH